MSENIEIRPSRDGKNCTYRVYLTYYSNGETKHYAKSFSSKKYGSKKMALELAKEHRDKMRLELSNLPYNDESCFLDNLMILKETTLPHTIHTNNVHRLYYKKFIRNITGNIDIKDVKANQIQSSLNAMVDDYPQDTINRVMTIWKQLYKTAIINDYCSFDMTMKAIVPKSNIVTKERKKTTSLNDMKLVCDSVLKHCEDREVAELIVCSLYIMYYTGMRPQEVYALNKENIDTENRAIHIRSRIGCTSSKKNVVVKTKTTQSIRDIFYPKELDPIFQQLMNRNDEYLFKTKKGFLNGDKVSDIIRRYRPVDFRAYNLRHQFSTDLLKQGVDLRTIQEIMGHADPSMTINYARSNDESKKDAVNRR